MFYTDSVLITNTVIIVIIFDKLSNFYYNNVFFKQFTVWNIISQLICYHNNTVILNSLNILILFHSLFVLDKSLLYIIPAQCNLSIFNFHIMNIFIHFIPFLFSIYFIHVLKINLIFIDFINSIIYLLIWSIYIKFDYTIYSINKKYYFKIFYIYIIFSIIFIFIF